MINTSTNVCIEKNCDTGASFNILGEKAKYCNKHKKEKMINVINKRCKEESCNITPSYGLTQFIVQNIKKTICLK